MMATRLGCFVSACAVAVLALGCTAVGPDYDVPTTGVPVAWREGTGLGLAEGPAALATWWSRFEDPVLDELVTRALHQGLDLREAVARVREARAVQAIARSGRLPAIDGSASYRRSQESETTAFGQFGSIRATDLFAAGFDASWEIDLWGRIQRGVEAAGADLQASVEDARDVLVMLVAETAVSYVELRAFEQRLAIARSNVSLQRQTLELVRARLDSGLASERDLAQAATNLATTRARVPLLDAGLRRSENRLAVLMGLPPGALAPVLSEPRAIPIQSLAVAVGVPADLLRRRADVRRAERTLAAETARVGLAEAELYPRLSLFGSLGLESAALSDLFTWSSAVFGFGPSLRWNIFDSGRLRNQVEAQDARREQALVRWERAVLVALEEAENAMTSFVREQLRRDALIEAVTEARRAVELSQVQYREGLTDFQPVLDSERTRADLEDDLAQSEAAITTDLIALYKALGGGWEHAGPFPDPSASAGVLEARRAP